MDYYDRRDDVRHRRHYCDYFDQRGASHYRYTPAAGPPSPLNQVPVTDTMRDVYDYAMDHPYPSQPYPVEGRHYRQSHQSYSTDADLRAMLPVISKQNTITYEAVSIHDSLDSPRRSTELLSYEATGNQPQNSHSNSPQTYSTSDGLSSDGNCPQVELLKPLRFVEGRLTPLEDHAASENPPMFIPTPYNAEMPAGDFTASTKSNTLPSPARISLSTNYPTQQLATHSETGMNCSTSSEEMLELPEGLSLAFLPGRVDGVISALKTTTCSLRIFYMVAAKYREVGDLSAAKKIAEEGLLFWGHENAGQFSFGPILLFLARVYYEISIQKKGEQQIDYIKHAANYIRRFRDIDHFLRNKQGNRDSQVVMASSKMTSIAHPTSLGARLSPLS
ncbi:hypothetical protein DL93DRAFT_1736437 [Clavulina sp. PMI_390]|nr:hypothetical protein DL93DRAFT_1736437 [Clavulina sp. PMI_390]